MQREHLDRPRPDLGDGEQPREVGVRRRGSRRARPRGAPRARPRGASPARACRARPQASSSAGAQAAIAARRRRVAQRAVARGRSAAIMRRWIAIARGMSISCSVIAHIRASHGVGVAAHAQPRAGADRAADQRVVAEARVELRQVVVDRRRRSASARCPRARPPPRRRARRRRCRRPPPRPARRRRAAAARARRRAGASARPATAARAGTSSAAHDLADEHDRLLSPSRSDDPAVGRRGCPLASTRGAAGGRRSGTSSTTRSRRSARPSCASWPPSWCGARETTATVAAPATKPVAASAAAWTVGTTRAPARTLLEHAGLRDHGQAVDDLPLLNFSVLVNHEGQTLPPAADVHGAEHAIPVRRADPEAALVVLEVVAHVQLPQPLSDPRARRVVVQG